MSNFQTAFEPSAYTLAFQIAEEYADKPTTRRARGSLARPHSGFLVPIGPIYSDEKYVIIRGKLGNAVDPFSFEEHYEFKEDPISHHRQAQDITVSESWLNTPTGPTFKIMWEDNA